MTWCLNRNITLLASRLAGKMNVIADTESRIMRDRSDWKLHPQVFREINRQLGPLQVDLFASRLTTQLQDFVSLRPDPEVIATDAFSIDWAEWRMAYANPLGTW